MDWFELAVTLYGHTERSEDSYCSSETEVRELARKVMVVVGREENEKLGEHEAMIRGAEIMKIGVKQYEDLLVTWWQFDDRSICHVLYKDKLIGITICVGISEDASARMEAGQCDFFDLKISDLRRESSIVHIHVVAVLPEALTSDKIKKSIAQANAVVAQIATILPMKAWKNNPPKLVVIAGSAKGEEMLRSYRLTYTGAAAPLTGHKVMVMQKPKSPIFSISKLDAYYRWKMMTLIFRMYQLGNRVRTRMRFLKRKGLLDEGDG
jgi:hypothetical protein